MIFSPGVPSLKASELRVVIPLLPPPYTFPAVLLIRCKGVKLIISRVMDLDGLSLYSTEKRDPTRMKPIPTKVKCTWPMRENLRLGPNTPYIPLTCIGVLRWD